MKNVNFPTSACRYCRYYQPEGRRGGCCQMLGVLVQGNWKACELSLPAFAPSWDLKKVMIVPDEPALVPTPSMVEVGVLKAEEPVRCGASRVRGCLPLSELAQAEE
ncbi:hypothetical protein [Chroococcidiopsis sp. TS-821]|uniref:hypothetical protein n=1 Tax=Chroococcidiopsis sp. TS-821 TaxID=1378066 RepID=UPI000D49E20E|nr:hypothetical protein [Chroococcidiopsis sp. TS-821]PPS44815.1 hypothetical protein B1A85_00550 [Chroococcidiopsis sp. TS-821]